MSAIDKSIQDLYRTVLKTGKIYENKNRGVKRLQIPSYTFRHDLINDGFPAITNKKIYWKGIVGELLWFLRGDNDVKFLNQNGINIWNKDAYNWYLKDFTKNLKNYATEVPLTFAEFEALGEGSVGRNYSVQWREFRSVDADKIGLKETDQIKDLIRGMREDIMSSRLKVNAWNPGELNNTALPPCHSEFQVVGVPLNFKDRMAIANARGSLIGFEGKKYSEKEMEDMKNTLNNYGIPEFGFELHWNQRSVDLFLGLPFNIASYALLAKILEKITGYPALGIEGTLKCVHFYENQYNATVELLKRDPNKHDKCEIMILGDFGKFTIVLILIKCWQKLRSIISNC